MIPGGARTPSFVNANPSPPDNGGGCLDAFTCGAGTTPGGGGGGGGGTGTNGNQVAVQRPAPGLPCRGSDSVGVSLNDQLPFGSTGKNNDVNNIFYLYEGATMSGNGILGGQVLVGWIAMTPTNYFVISNGKDGNFVHNIIAQLSGARPKLDCHQ